MLETALPVEELWNVEADLEKTREGAGSLPASQATGGKLPMSSAWDISQVPRKMACWVSGS